MDSLTPVAKLGKDASEVYPNFDDIDDFKGYSRRDTISNGILFSKVNVVYINPNSPDDSSKLPTYYKKISVSVIDSSTMVAPITLTNIITY